MRRRFLWILVCLPLIIFLPSCSKSGVPPEAKALLKQQKYEEGLALLEKAHASDSRNQEVRAELVSATVAYANELTYKSNLPPNEKYPKALHLYRRALQLEPRQQEALEGKNLIESIYVSMGRPIPQ